MKQTSAGSSTTRSTRVKLQPRTLEAPELQKIAAKTPCPPGSKINIKLLNEVKEAILANANHFDMETWGDTHSIYLEYGDVGLADLQPDCGTTACIAGFVCLIEGLKLTNDGTFFKQLKSRKNYVSPLAYARKKLGLLGQAGQSSQLFYADSWPDNFAEAYSRAASRGDHREMAKVAADRIDFFIKTCGTDKE